MPDPHDSIVILAGVCWLVSQSRILS